MFQIKNFVSISAAIGNYMQSVSTRINDFRVGAIFRTIVESVAAEMDELYQQIFTGLTEAIPVSIYQAFNFPALVATSSNGNITVTISIQAANVIIPAGTVFSIGGASGYTSQNDVTITAGSTTGVVFVAAVLPGTAGNIPVSQSFAAQPTITGFVSATNLAPWTNGTNAETPAEQQLRFNDYIAALQHGTVAAIGYGLSTANVKDANGNIIESVSSYLVYEPFLTDITQPNGLIFGYIFNGSSGASSALIASATKIIYGYYTSAGVAVPGFKAAGITCTVLAAPVTNVPVTGVITLPSIGNYVLSAVEAAAAASVANYISSLGLGQPALCSKIIALIQDTPGVYNLSLSAPSADVTTTAAYYKLMPGTIALT